MEIVLATTVGLLAVIVTLLSVITGRQQREIESLWKEVGGLNAHLIDIISNDIKAAEGNRAAFEIQSEINEALLKLVEEKHG